MLITIFIQGLFDGPVRNHLFCGEIKTLSEAIYAAEQEDFSVRQAHTTLTPFRPQRRPAVGGPEPMDLCYVEGEKPRPVNDKRSVRCHHCRKLVHYPFGCSIPRSEPRGAERSNRLPVRRTGGRGSDAIAKPQQRGGPSKKWSGSVGAERPTNPATSIEFVNLLTKVAPGTQSRCVSAPGDKVSLITLTLEVTKDLSLRAVADCGASNNFVRRQSLDVEVSTSWSGRSLQQE